MFIKSHLPLRAVALVALLSLGQMAAFAVPGTDFSLRGLDGQTVSSASVKGKVVVLAIGASWLPLSRAQAQGVQKLADNFGGRAVEVFWVSTDSESQKSKNYASDEQIRAFATKYGLKVKVLRDPEGVTSKQLGADQLPAIIILDKEGNVSGAPIGGLDPNGNFAEQVEARVNRLL